MGWPSIVTVEPAMFLQQVGDTLTYVIYQNLFIDKICRTELGYSTAICDLYAQISDDLTPEQEFLQPVMNQIQTASSEFLLYNSLVENSLPVFLVLFLGVWSDKQRRRKPPLILCLLGKMLRSFGLFLNAYFFNWPPILLLFTAALPHALGGANAVFHMSAFSYIADSSVPRSRTWRLGIAEAFWQLGSPIGLFLGAYLFQQGGYLCVFGASFSFHLISVLYTAFLLPEVPQPKPSKFLILSKHGNYGTYTEAPIAKRIRYYSEHETNENKGSSTDVFGGDIAEEEDDYVDHSDVEAKANANNNNTENFDHQFDEHDDDDKQSLLHNSKMKSGKTTGHHHPNKTGSNYLAPPPPPPHPIELLNQHQRGDITVKMDQNTNSGHENEEPSSVYEFVVGSVRAIIRPRPNHTRKCLLSLGAIMLLYGIAFYGEANMKYLFTRNKFQWRETQFSAWTIFDAIIVVAGLTVAMPIFSKLLKLSDPLAGAIAAFARTASRLCFALAPQSRFLFYGSLMDIPGVIGPLSARSLASKCVLRDERGRVFAFLGCIEAVVPLLAVPLYSLIYTSTLTFAPSAIYYMSTSIYASIFIIFGVLYVALKMKIVQFSGTDVSSLLNPMDKTEPVSAVHFSGNIYRRSSLS